MTMGLLDKRTAIITGGSDGIGRAIAMRFAEEGAHVIICARTQAKLDETLASISNAGGKCEAHCLDIADTNAWQNLIDTVAAQHGLDILVNNAPHVGYGMIADTSLSDFRKNFEINLDATYIGTQAAMKHMAATGGSIINLASINGERAMQGMSGYASAKAAVLHFTRSAATEGAHQNIRVNAITPGPIMTPGTQAYFKADPKAGEAIANANPMGRIGNPKEVADVAVFLASNLSSYVTGATIPVDGGKTNELYVPS